MCHLHQKVHGQGPSQDFNSLDAQREAGEAYILSQRHEGWVALPDRYDDGGFTGGNMDRPALRRLLVDIEAGRIDTVVTYKVDRLSRSLLDFARLMDVFDRHGVRFVAVTQQLDTRSSFERRSGFNFRLAQSDWPDPIGCATQKWRIAATLSGPMGLRTILSA